MLRTFWQSLAAFLLHPNVYMLAQAWLLLVTLWWAFQAHRLRARFRDWFVPAGGLVGSHLAGLVLTWLLLSQPNRYTPWWPLRALQAIAAYFLLWAWMWPQGGRREVEWYRGGMVLLVVPAVPASVALHALSPDRWPGLETLWLLLGALTGLGALAVLVLTPQTREPWALTTAALLSLGFLMDVWLPHEQRAGARLAEMAVYPLLLAWPEVYSVWDALQTHWRERWAAQERALSTWQQRVDELQTEIETLRSTSRLALPQTAQTWYERGGYLFWQAFAETLRMVQDTLQRLATSSAVARTLPPDERNALLQLEAIARFHHHALEVAARSEENQTGEWRPWAHIWNRVLQAIDLFAQSRDQTLVLALPDEIFTWDAPEEPAYEALYLVLARALWVSNAQSEILVQGHVVQTETGLLGVMLEIVDHGPPLTEDEQVRVFFAADEALEATSPEATPHAVGTHLGLRLARWRLLAVQGSLWVAEARNDGSTIAVLIPTRRAAGATPASARTKTGYGPTTA